MRKGKDLEAARIGVLVGRRRKIAGKEIFFLRKLSARIGEIRGFEGEKEFW